MKSTVRNGPAPDHYAYLLLTSLLSFSPVSLSAEQGWDLTASAWLGHFVGGDDDGWFGRFLPTISYMKTSTIGRTAGVRATLEVVSDRDRNRDNISDEADIRWFSGVAFLQTDLGTFVVGRDFGANTKNVPSVPNVFGVNHTINSPVFLNVRRLRFSPRSPSISPDYVDTTERASYFYDKRANVVFGVSWAPESRFDLENLIEVSTYISLPIQDSRVIAIALGASTASAPEDTSIRRENETKLVVSTNLQSDLDIGFAFEHTINAYGLEGVRSNAMQIGVSKLHSGWHYGLTAGYAVDLYPGSLGSGNATARFYQFGVRRALRKNISLLVGVNRVSYRDSVIGESRSTRSYTGVVELSVSL